MCRYLKRANGYQIDIDECYLRLGGSKDPNNRNIMCVEGAWEREQTCAVRKNMAKVAITKKRKSYV